MTLSAGWLAIDGIRFRCVIGATHREREILQEIVAALHVQVDFARAAASDSIGDAVDYRALTRRLIAAGESSRFHLVETLAAHLVRVILDDFPGVQEVRVEVEKPGALSTARSVRAMVAATRE
jgi:dihydroneopterin aldolase